MGACHEAVTYFSIFEKKNLFDVLNKSFINFLFKSSQGSFTRPILPCVLAMRFRQIHLPWTGNTVEVEGLEQCDLVFKVSCFIKTEKST
jgi:hypothetical protein